MPQSNLFDLMLNRNNLPGYKSTSYTTPNITGSRNRGISTGIPGAFSNIPEYKTNTNKVVIRDPRQPGIPDVIDFVPPDYYDIPGINVAKDGIYTLDPSKAGSPISGGEYDIENRGYPTQNLIDARQTSRDLNVNNILDELEKPSHANFFAAGPTDQLVRGLRNRQNITDAELQRRGLEYTGARDVADRGLDEYYAGNLLDIEGGARQAEFDRQGGFISALQRIMQEDAQFGIGLGELDLLQREVNNTKNLRNQQEDIDFLRTGLGGLQLGLTGVGAYVGATGGLSGPGGLEGGIQGAGLVNQVTGGGGAYIPNSYSAGGSTYRQNNLPGVYGAGNYSVAGLGPYFNALNLGYITPGSEEAEQFFQSLYSK